MSAPSSALHGLDPALTAPKRVGAMALLSRSTGSDFAYLCGHLGVSDSDLSKQMSALKMAGYVKVTKSGRGRGSTTTFQATKAGRLAEPTGFLTLERCSGSTRPSP